MFGFLFVDMYLDLQDAPFFFLTCLRYKQTTKDLRKISNKPETSQRRNAWKFGHNIYKSSWETRPIIRKWWGSVAASLSINSSSMASHPTDTFRFTSSGCIGGKQAVARGFTSSERNAAWVTLRLIRTGASEAALNGGLTSPHIKSNLRLRGEVEGRWWGGGGFEWVRASITKCDVWYIVNSPGTRAEKRLHLAIFIFILRPELFSFTESYRMKLAVCRRRETEKTPEKSPQQDDVRLL